MSAMDINKVQQQLIQALEQKNADQLTTLSRILNLVVGKSTNIEVVSSEPMTPDEQKALQQQTATALSQVREQIRNLAAKIDPKAAEMDDQSLSQNTKIPPAIRALFTRLLNQQQLLSAPQLRWIEISQNGQKTPLYTDQPLVTGQKISIQLSNPQRLSLMTLADVSVPVADDQDIHLPQVILNSQKALTTAINQTESALDIIFKKPGLGITNDPSKTASSLPAIDAPENKNNATQLLLKNALALSGYKQLLPNDVANNTTKNIQQKPFTSESILEATEKLGQLLSLKPTTSSFYPMIDKLTSTNALAQPETKSLEQLLKSIAEKIRTPDFFQRADGLKQTIRQSGIFYESRLNQLIKNNLPTNSYASQENQKFDATVFTKNISNKLQNLVTSDSKGSLLNLIKRAENSSPNLSSENLTRTTNSGSADDLQSLIKDLIKQSLSNNATDLKLGLAKLGAAEKGDANNLRQISQLVEQLQTKDLSTQTREKITHEIIKLIQQEAAHSLTKIQIQQFQSLLQRNDSELGNKHQTQSWQLEIPVKHQNEVHPFQVEIERHWLPPDESSDTPSTSPKTKQWNITLRFDLPNMGEFCAQLSMQGETLNAKLWADRENTLRRIQDELEKLRQQMESDGIVVKSLLCSGGLPPQKQIRLSYSLIDVST